MGGVLCFHILPLLQRTAHRIYLRVLFRHRHAKLCDQRFPQRNARGGKAGGIHYVKFARLHVLLEQETEAGHLTSMEAGGIKKLKHRGSDGNEQLITGKIAFRQHLAVAAVQTHIKQIKACALSPDVYNRYAAVFGVDVQCSTASACRYGPLAAFGQNPLFQQLSYKSGHCTGGKLCFMRKLNA